MGVCEKNNRLVDTTSSFCYAIAMTFKQSRVSWEQNKSYKRTDFFCQKIVIEHQVFPSIQRFWIIAHSIKLKSWRAH